MDVQVWDFKRLAPKGWKVMTAKHNKDMEDFTAATAFKSFSTKELKKMIA